jgi:signal transduction histidine kinase
LACLIFLGYRQRLRTSRKLNAQAAEIQAQKIRQLEQDNQLLSLNAMIEGQESERTRIAQDLHDGIGGLLTTVKAHFYAIQEQVDKLQQLNIYQKTNDLIDEACIEVRRISQNMMPRSLQLLGIKGAIEDLATQLRQQNMDCELEIIGLDETLSRTRKVMLFRIVQELCNNISKHAQARHIFIQLLQHGETINLIVEDDGQGFNYQTARAKSPSLGLKNIESRVKYLRGSWDVDSVPGEGTTVMIQIPIR